MTVPRVLAVLGCAVLLASASVAGSAGPAAPDVRLFLEELSALELERRRRPRLEVAVRDLARGASILRNAGFEPVQGGDEEHPRLELREARAIENPDDVARLLVEGGAPPCRLAVEQEDIEEHFLRITAGNSEPEP